MVFTMGQRKFDSMAELETFVNEMCAMMRPTNRGSCAGPPTPAELRQAEKDRRWAADRHRQSKHATPTATQTAGDALANAMDRADVRHLSDEERAAKEWDDRDPKTWGVVSKEIYLFSRVAELRGLDRRFTGGVVASHQI